MPTIADESFETLRELVDGCVGEAMSQEPVAWKPEAWERNLGPLPLDDRLLDRAQLSRQDVLALAPGALADERSLRGFVIAVMAWGWGLDGRGPVRTSATLDSPRSTEALRAIVEATRERGAVAGYTDARDVHPPQLGPSFGSKLIYFAGRDVATPMPLILDARVGAALDGVSLRLKYKRWQPDDYAAYLRLATDLADAVHAEPDDVEHRLFEVGARVGVPVEDA
jgi:Putative 8-oxoguanine DNA glycosylase OGG-like protein